MKRKIRAHVLRLFAEQQNTCRCCKSKGELETGRWRKCRPCGARWTVEDDPSDERIKEFLGFLELQYDPEYWKWYGPVLEMALE